MKQLLNERIVTKGRIIESDGAKLPKGVLCRTSYNICNIDKLNANNRMYEKTVWENVFGSDEIKEKLKGRTLWGHSEHPEKIQSNIEKVSHIVTGMSIDEKTNEVKADIDVLDTPYGRIVNTLLLAECGIGVSTRAEGELEEREDKKFGKYYRVIPEAYKFITVDFTADPSTFGTYPEKVERDVVDQIKAGVESKKIDQQYATVMLEQMKGPEAKMLLESIKKTAVKEEVAAEEMCRCGKNKVEKGSTQCKACLDAADAEKARHENESKKPEFVFESFDDMVKFFEAEFKKPDSPAKKKMTGMLSEALQPAEARSNAKAIRIDAAVARAERDVLERALTANLAVLREAYQKDAVDLTARIIENVKKLKAAQAQVAVLEAAAPKQAAEIKTLSEAKTQCEVGSKAQAAKLVEADVKVKELSEKVAVLEAKVAEGAKVLEVKVAEMTKAHSKALIQKYFETRVKASGMARYLKEGTDVPALLEHCSTEKHVDALIRKITEKVEDDMLHSSAPSAVVVARNTDPVTSAIATKVGSILEGMHK